MDLNQILRHGTNKPQSRSAFDSSSSPSFMGPSRRRPMGPLYHPKDAPPRLRRILPTSQCLLKAPQSHRRVRSCVTFGCMSGTTSRVSFFPALLEISKPFGMTPCTRPPFAFAAQRPHPSSQWSRRRRSTQGHAGPRRAKRLARRRAHQSIA